MFQFPVLTIHGAMPLWIAVIVASIWLYIAQLLCPGCREQAMSAVSALQCLKVYRNGR